MEPDRLKEFLRRAYERRKGGPSPSFSPSDDPERTPPDIFTEAVISLDADFPVAALARAVNAEITGDPACPILVRKKTFPSPLPLSVPAQSLRFLWNESADAAFVAQSLQQGRALVFDTETTGLAGGTGTLIFLAGFAWIDLAHSALQVCQYFLPDPSAEPSFLNLVGSHFAPEVLLVTYNGRTFDYPILRTRFRLYRREDPRIGAHLDLLPAARRLLKFYIPDRSLPSLEAGLLRKPRHGDIPGELIPREYQIFLRFGEIGRLPEIFEHNLRDLLSLFDLLRTLCELASPQNLRDDPRIALARGIFQRYLGEDKEAFASLTVAFEGIERAGYDRNEGMDPDHIRRLCKELGVVARRLGQWEVGLRAWHLWASRFSHPAPCVEIAKYYEHEVGDFEQALRWAYEAQSRARDEREYAEIQHRIWRLRRRMARMSRPAGDASENGILPCPKN